MRLLLLLLACLLTLPAPVRAEAPDVLLFQPATAGVACHQLGASDRRWKPVGLRDVQAAKRYCLQAHIARPVGSADQLALKVTLLGAYQLYWNGKRLGANGVPGDSAQTEQAGTLGSIHLLTAKHPVLQTNVLSIDMSTFHASPKTKSLVHAVRLDGYANLLTRPWRDSMPIIAACGAMLLMALYMLIVYAFEKRSSAQLLFALLCVLFTALLIAEVWKELIGYRYHLHVVRLQLILAFSAGIALVLPCFYAAFYQLPMRLPMLAAAAGALILVAAPLASYDLASLAVLGHGILASLVINVMAVRRRLPFSRINLAALAAMACALLLAPVSFADRWLFLLFPLLALALLLALAQENHSYRQQAMRAVRLENDLLRRSLQPHFLMNSLTMVMEWIEQSPPKALQFIEALAAEFRLLNRCADQRLVSVADELALCRSHLDIMGYRKERIYQLEAGTVDPALQVPPALLHTLIENAFSHSKLDFDASFTLSQYISGERIGLRFACPHDGKLKHAGSAIGLRYLHGRMNDAYGTRWSMEQTSEDGIWRTDFLIPVGRGECTS
jgi:uncharacterized membrane protein